MEEGLEALTPRQAVPADLVDLRPGSIVKATIAALDKDKRLLKIQPLPP